MTPSITRVIPLYPKTNFVQWTVDDPTSILTSLELLRSGSPEGPFTTVISDLSKDTYFFTDTNPSPYGLTSRVWYQLRAVPVSGAINSVYSDPVTPGNRARDSRGKILRKARYDLGITLSKLSGVRVTILKRKKFGTRCPVCYNESTKDVVISHCNTCYGTSYEGGYHMGYATWGKLAPATIQEGHDRTGPSELGMSSITIADYPLVEVDDLIVDNDTNRRFIVKRKMSTESSGLVVHQDLQISELSRAAVEYAIPVDFNA